ncbi:MAG: protein kinase [Polyangiaceae bacterium]
MSAPLAPGSIIGGKYRLLALIGEGGMGQVWKALHLTLDSEVAIKFINAELAGSGDMAKRFTREARAAAALRSPHVVQILDYGMEGHVAFQVMELLQGESLAARLQRDRVLPPREVARILQHVARALAKAHDAGIVHRDLKPDNIYLTHADDELIAKVLDFGIAKFRSGNQTMGTTTRTGAVMGTPYYMSPEQAEGNRDVDQRTDIWAMGVIAFECMLGKKPFDSDAFGNLLLKICAHPLPVPSQWGPVPGGFDAWFARAVNRDASQRFDTAKEAAEQLTAICGDVTSPEFDASARASAADARRPPAFAATNQPLSRTLDPVPTRSAWPLLLGGVVLLGAVGAGAFALTRGDATPTADASALGASASAVPETPPLPSSEAPEVTTADETLPDSPAASATPPNSASSSPSPQPAAPPASKPAPVAKPAPKPAPDAKPVPGAKPSPQPKPAPKPTGVATPEDLL